MDINKNEILYIIKDILIYWAKQILEKGLYLLIIILLSFIILYCGSPYGRYLDSWLE